MSLSNKCDSVRTAMSTSWRFRYDVIVIRRAGSLNPSTFQVKMRSVVLRKCILDLSSWADLYRTCWGALAIALGFRYRGLIFWEPSRCFPPPPWLPALREQLGLGFDLREQAG